MKHLSLIIALCFFLGAVFFYFPEIDLFIASVFYHPEIGFKNRSYYLENFNPLMLSLDLGAVYVVPFLFIAFVALFAYRIYQKAGSLHYKHYIPIIYIVVSTSIGTLLTVNIIKDKIVCRARPEAVQEFNGQKIFTPAFAISDQCTHNCSFVSGHAAAIFMSFSLAFLIENKKKRRLAIFYIILLGLMVGFGRVSFGRHFVSDVIFAGFFVYIISYITAMLFKLPSTQRDHDHKKRT